MKGIVILTVIFLILLIIGPLMPAPPITDFSYSVIGCAETEDGKGTRSINDTRETSGPVITITDSIITYQRNLDQLCCRKVIVDYSLRNQVLDIYEVWTGPGCRCICYSEINATISVPEDTYVVNVYETGTDPETGEKMIPILMLTQTVQLPDLGNTSPQ